MRKFTTLFLLALAMTIGASQAFAQSNNDSNSVGAIDKPDRPDRPDRDDGAEDDDSDDPLTPDIRRLISVDDCSPTHGFRCDVPPEKPKKKRVVVQKEPEDCGCKHKTVRVGARFVTVTDCYYQTISLNGRAQMRYCTKDD